MVCKDGRWPDHAAYFYKQLSEHFEYTSGVERTCLDERLEVFTPSTSVEREPL